MEAHGALRRLGLDQLLHEGIERELAGAHLGQQLRIATRHAVHLQVLQICDDLEKEFSQDSDIMKCDHTRRRWS